MPVLGQNKTKMNQKQRVKTILSQAKASYFSVFHCVFKQNPFCSEDVRASNLINLVWNKTPEAPHCEILLGLLFNLKKSGLDAAENNYEHSTSQTFHFR